MKKFTTSTYANLYLNAAEGLGLSIRIEDKKTSTARIFNANTHITIVSSNLGINTLKSKVKTDNKDITSGLLLKKGIPVPHFEIFVNQPEALTYALSLLKKNIPIVVKPSDGSNARGVSVKPVTKLQLIRSINEAFSRSSKIIIEEYIEGQHYRITVLDDEIIAITQRIPAYITGDSTSTVDKLIELKNIMRAHKKLPLITLRDKDHDYLKSADINLTNIYPNGKNIRLQNGCDYEVGGERERIDLHSVPLLNQKMFVKAIKTLKLRFGGIDYISPDITVPYTQITSAINEINYKPHQDVHYFDSSPNNNYAAERIIEKIFERNT
jgi:cyanophycin synthetase